MISQLNYSQKVETRFGAHVSNFPMFSFWIIITYVKLHFTILVNVLRVVRLLSHFTSKWHGNLLFFYTPPKRAPQNPRKPNPND